VMIAGTVLALFRGRRAPPALVAATVAFAAYGVWIAVFQNPDQLRHLGPLLVLGGLILTMLAGTGARLPAGGAVIALVLEVAGLGGTASPDPRMTSPLAAVTAVLAADGDAAVATNAGVATLRAALPGARVYDAYYTADAAFGLREAAGPAFRISMTPITGITPAAEFRGRFAGEPTLWLYRVK